MGVNDSGVGHDFLAFMTLKSPEICLSFEWEPWLVILFLHSYIVHLQCERESIL